MSFISLSPCHTAPLPSPSFLLPTQLSLCIFLVSLQNQCAQCFPHSLYFTHRFFDAQFSICGPLEFAHVLLISPLLVCESFLAFWHQLYQVHLVCFLTQTWNQPLLPMTLVPFCEEWFLDLDMTWILGVLIESNCYGFQFFFSGQHYFIIFKVRKYFQIEAKHFDYIQEANCLLNDILQNFSKYCLTLFASSNNNKRRFSPYIV